MTPEQAWDNFIHEMHIREPLKNEDRHINFIGSIASYRKIFLEANARFDAGIPYLDSTDKIRYW